ncbi:MAG: hypothetical protein KF732_07775 [Flavobacteriales bacterium]|nr:hypothetical protein [Flavobacteriales bacterium]
MNQFKILITIGFAFFTLSTLAQTGKFTFGKSDSTIFRGFGVGFEYYSGHKELSKIFKFKRNPIDEYKIGKGFYVTYFNLNQKKKFHYYIDGGFVFWNMQRIDSVSTLNQRSEILQFTGRYRMGSFGLLGRLGGLMNHNTIVQDESLSEKKNNNIDLTIGLGLSIPIPLPKTKGLNLTILISRVNQHYTWSGTVFLPLIFH